MDTFHKANLIALRKIGVTNVANIFSKGTIEKKVSEFIYNATSVILSNVDDTHSIMNIQFGDIADEFAITWEKKENGTYKVVSIK